MRTTSPPRRAASLLAVGATGAAAVLFGFAAPAQAASLPELYVSTDSGSGVDTVLSGGSYTIPTGYCSVTWSLYGAGGGAGYDGTDSANPVINDGSQGGYLQVTTPVAAGQTVAYVTGVLGGDASNSGGGALGTGNPPGAAGLDQLVSSAIVGGSGGGGGATSVSVGSFSLVAHGGAGGPADASTAGGDGGNGTSNSVTGGATPDTDDDTGNFGDGSIDAFVAPCPEAPTGLSAEGGNGEATVYFSPADSGTPADSWQYSVGGGTWTDTGITDAYTTYFTVPGLTNGDTVSIRVRGVVGASGFGAASAAVSVTPAVPNGAPTHVVVTPGPSSYVVTWGAPTTAGTFPVDHYVVGYDNGQSGGPLCESVPATARRCVGAALPGGNYGISVWAVDTKGNSGTHSSRVAVGTITKPTVPDAAPTSTDHLQLPAGTDAALATGEKVTLSGSGYLPNSTISVIIYSSPQVLTSVVTDATGSFRVTVTVPDGLENGNHTLVASGVDSTGQTRYVTLPVTVTGGTTGSGGLAYTGVDIALPLTGGLIALGVGAALMFVARRRKVSGKAA